MPTLCKPKREHAQYFSTQTQKYSVDVQDQKLSLTFFIPATNGIDSSSALADGGVGGLDVTNKERSAAIPDGAMCTPSYHTNKPIHESVC